MGVPPFSQLLTTHYSLLTLLSLFNFGPKSKLGIDIGTSSIKIVELEDSGRFKLKNYGLFELQSADGDLDVDSKQVHSKLPVHLNDADLVWGIKETLRLTKTTTKDAVASIQSFSTFSTVITMPYLSENEIAKAIPFEAKKYIPLPLAEVILDWSIINAKSPIGSAPSTGDGSSGSNFKDESKLKNDSPIVEVFLVAVPRDEAARYQFIMKQAGLNLRALELENNALIRAVMGNDLGPAAIINIGGRSSSILIVDKGIERLSHNYEVGGFEITKSISRSMNISLQRAEEMKRTLGFGKDESNAIKQSTSSLIDLIVFETRKTIHNYEDSRQTRVGKVFLVGGLTNMPGFLEYFKEKLKFEIAPGNPTARIIIPAELEPLRKELNSTFSVALGLAMRKI